MKPKLHFCEQLDCKLCTETTDRGFKYIKTVKGEKYVFDIVNTYTMVFILAGEASVSCNEFNNVLFHEGQIILWPMSSNCAWESLTDTSAIVLYGDDEMHPCDKKLLSEYADLWFDTILEFKALPIRPRLKEFLSTVKNYLDDGITCPFMHKNKQWELSTIFRAYYSSEELIRFFFPSMRMTREFEQFVINNYLKMKGVKEFVDLSGMNLHTFNRKFKTNFGMTPYQWIIKQKSKHVYHDLTYTDKSLAAIAKEFHFTDASHFNRFCKSTFGNSPSQIRENVSAKKRVS